MGWALGIVCMMKRCCVLRVFGPWLLAGLALLLAAPVQAQSGDFVDFATISGTAPLVSGSVCYSDGRDLVCDGSAGLRVTSGTVQIPAISANAIGAVNVSATGGDFATLRVGGVAVTGGGTPDRIVGSNANVVAGGGMVSISTGGVTGTAYVDTAGRLVAPGVSVTGVVRADGGMHTSQICDTGGGNCRTPAQLAATNGASCGARAHMEVLIDMRGHGCPSYFYLQQCKNGVIVDIGFINQRDTGQCDYGGGGN